jgi:NAD(P)H-dependent FMN reductase
MDKLKIITSTTRPERKGIALAHWVAGYISNKSIFDSELLDLADIGLPLLDEPKHPRLKEYTQEHTRKWSAMIDEADAFVIVLAEYNHGYPAPIKNALDFLFHEWRHKPVGFVSYGGVSGGMRSMQMLKPTITALSMMPLAESVSIPSFAKNINEDGVFKGYELLEKSMDGMLKELARWSTALKSIRVKEKASA